MSDSPDRPPSSGSTGGPTSGASGPGSNRSGGQRNRRRRGSGGGSASSSGGARSGSGSGGSGGTRSGGARNGNGNGNGGGNGRGSGGNGRGSGGGNGRSSSGGQRHPGQGGGRHGQGNRSRGAGGGGTRGGGMEREPVAAPPPVVRVDRGAERAEEGAASANRRRAMVLSLIPGAVVGVLAGIVLLVLGLPLFAVVALVVVTAAGAAWLWGAAPRTVLSALGARPSDEAERPRLHNLVDGLCATMGLDRPAIAVVDSDVPNALALGRDAKTATLVVTSGLERALTLVELEGVLAHELVHIKRQDTALSAVAVLVAAPWAVLRGTPTGAEVVHGLVGRGREFSADQRAALVVRYPAGIGSALGTMVGEPVEGAPWPPAPGRVAALTRWLWVDPMAGSTSGGSTDGNLDDTRVRAAALALD
jgi:Zn-dependent protease with chaperone function